MMINNSPHAPPYQGGFKTTQGVESQDRAKEHLEKYLIDYNVWDRICPVMGEKCHGFKCASWKKAKVFLSNLCTLPEDQSVYDIEHGSCRNPMVTGIITTRPV
jgi:hypothetical protein